MNYSGMKKHATTGGMFSEGSVDRRQRGSIADRWGTWVCLLTVLAVSALPLRAAVSASVSAPAPYYVSAGGTASFAVAVDYAGQTPSAIVLQVQLPAGWTYGADQLPVGAETVSRPVAGDNVLDWAFSSFPVDRLAFSFTAAYPAGLTGGQVVSVPVLVYRSPQESITVPSIQFIPNVIATQPVNRSATAGGSVTFSVGVTGAPSATYQWRKNGVDIAGATGASFTIGNVRLADAGSYTVAVGSALGPVVSEPGVLSVSSLTYSAWQGAEFSSGEVADAAVSALAADPDGDDLNNLLEYALALAPKIPDVSGRPTLSTSNGALTLSYLRRTDVGDLTYTVEASNDLVSWTSGPTVTAESSVTTLSPSREQVIVKDATSLSATTRRFLRLRVNHSSGAVAKTVPLGAIRPTFAAGNRFSGMSLVNPAVARGSIASHSSAAITLSYAGRSIGAALTTGTDYFVELTGPVSGTYVGARLEVDVAATKLSDNNTITVLPGSPRSTLSTLPASSGLAGHTLVVRPHVTLGQILGTKNNPLMQGATVVASADQVQLLNPQSQAFETYYFLRNSTGSVAQWTKIGGGSANQDALPIPPGVGMVVVRNTASAVTLDWLGEVRTNRSAQPLVAGNNLVSQPVPIDSSPVQRALTFANGATGSTVTTQADNLQTLVGGVIQTYYLLRNASGSVEQWTRIGSGTTNQNNAVLFTADGAVVVKKFSADPNYYVPNTLAP
jgi:hypothetical protein